MLCLTRIGLNWNFITIQSPISANSLLASKMCQHHPIAISQLSSWWFGFLNMFVSFLPHATVYLHVTPNLLFGLSSGDFVYLNIITHHEDKLELLVAWIVSTTPNQEPTDQARSSARRAYQIISSFINTDRMFKTMPS